MKVRESDMPPEEQWDKFFNPTEILKRLGMDCRVQDVADFGSGYGTFTIPAAQLVSGIIYAIDIDADKVSCVNKKAQELRLGNVRTVLRDFISLGSGLKDLSVDFVMLFNILHLENPLSLLKEAYRILKPGGKVGIIHWNYDASTPRGPPLRIRPQPQQSRQWAEMVGFIFEEQFDFKPYHYGLLLRK